MKYALIALGAIPVLVAGYAAYVALVANPSVARELHENPQGERARKVMLITLPSGRTIPVNYLREGGSVYAAADGRWWRELRGDGASVELLLRGKTLPGRARAIEGDPDRRSEVFDRLRPSAPKIFGTLVEIDLTAWLACDLVQAIAGGIPRTSVQRSSGVFTHEAFQQPVRGCRLVITGSFEAVLEGEDAASRLREGFAARGWREMPAYSADGKDGTAFAFRNAEATCLFRGVWDGGSDGEPPTPAGWSYRVSALCTHSIPPEARIGEPS